MPTSSAEPSTNAAAASTAGNQRPSRPSTAARAVTPKNAHATTATSATRRSHPRGHSTGTRAGAAGPPPAGGT